MIVSASYRTDIPAFHADWFAARLEDGHCDVASPRGGAPYRVALTPDRVDGFVFWTRNAAPFGAALGRVAALGVPFVVHFTVTGYPRALDAHTVRADAASAQIAALARAHGPRAVVWRYDPVVLTSLTPPDWHERNFSRLAAGLRGHVDECVVSFAHIYRKTRRRLDGAARRGGFSWRDPETAEKRRLAARLAAVAAGHGMRLALCSQPGLAAGAAGEARCIDPGRLSDIAGREIGARRRGNRPGCLCAESRDIGAYDTCAHGCVYCYAVSDHGRAAAALGRGRPAGAPPGAPAGGGAGGGQSPGGAFATATRAGRSSLSWNM